MHFVDSGVLRAKHVKLSAKRVGFKKKQNKKKQKNVSCDVTSFQNLLFTSHIGENQRWQRITASTDYETSSKRMENV